MAKSEVESSQFVAFALAKISPNRNLNTDIYLYINDHYIKFKEAGDLITSEKYNHFHSKNLREIFVKVNQASVMQNWIESLREELFVKIKNELGQDAVALAQMDNEIREIVFDIFSDQEVNSYTVSVLKKNSEEFIHEVSANPSVVQFLLRIGKISGTLVDHSVNTANFAIFVAMLNGIATKSELELIYLAAIFHDCSKAKIPVNILENENSSTFVMAINDHPTKSAEMVSKLSNIPAIVVKIIEQHHEQYNGLGYPNKVSGNEILPLAQFLSIANIYENELVKNRKLSEIEGHRKAVKLIEYDHGKFFKPEYTKRTIHGFKLALASDTRD